MHGITFALLHLALMRRLAETVPPHLSATALTLYGTVAIGAVSAVMTLVSGWLYGAIGPAGFWVMARFAVPRCRSHGGFEFVCIQRDGDVSRRVAQRKKTPAGRNPAGRIEAADNQTGIRRLVGM